MNDYTETELANLARGFCPDGCCGPEDNEITLNVSEEVLEVCEVYFTSYLMGSLILPRLPISF